MDRISRHHWLGVSSREGPVLGSLRVRDFFLPHNVIENQLVEILFFVYLLHHWWRFWGWPLTPGEEEADQGNIPLIPVFKLVCPLPQCCRLRGRPGGRQKAQGAGSPQEITKEVQRSPKTSILVSTGSALITGTLQTIIFCFFGKKRKYFNIPAYFW